MDYWTEHPGESRNADDAKVKKSTLLTYYYENILADTDEATIKNLENESEEMQLYLAQYYFSDFVYLFDNNEFSKCGVSGLNCFRGDDDGNIFLYRAKDANGHVYELTPLSSDINIRGKESVIRAINSRSYDEDSPSGVIYQMEKTSYTENDKQREINLYVGYMPVIYNGAIKAVIELDYDWSDFYIQLSKRLITILTVLIALCALECIYIAHKIRRIAVRPLTAAQDAVREYMTTKDGRTAREKLGRIKSKNEISSLVADIERMTAEIDDHIESIEAGKPKLNDLIKGVIKALANAIDAKDKYTHGHSSRVADYSRRLAEMNGKNEQECEEIYYAGLLHDIGKSAGAARLSHLNRGLCQDDRGINAVILVQTPIFIPTPTG